LTGTSGTQGIYPHPAPRDRPVMRLPGPVRVLRPLGTEDCPLVVMVRSDSVAGRSRPGWCWSVVAGQRTDRDDGCDVGGVAAGVDQHQLGSRQLDATTRSIAAVNVVADMVRWASRISIKARVPAVSARGRAPALKRPTSSLRTAIIDELDEASLPRAKPSFAIRMARPGRGPPLAL
jgi:hypothetical protein